MATHDPDALLAQYLKGDTPLSRAYRAGAPEEPPSALDAAIVAQARRAVGSRPRAAWSPFARHWLVPASAAAVLVVSVGVALLLSREGALEPAPQPQLRARPAQPPASAHVPAEVAEAVRPGVQAKAEAGAPGAPPVGTPPAEERAATARDLSSERVVAEGAEAKHAPAKAATLAKAAAAPVAADVLAVSVSGAAGSYQLAVTIRSPDEGCQRYADWWEVVSEDGRLLYRRVLLHSHRDEQPFTRTGGPVPIAADTVVWVRAHMHPAGYGGQVLRGSVRSGFQPAGLAAGFAAELAKQGPRPEGCDF